MSFLKTLCFACALVVFMTPSLDSAYYPNPDPYRNIVFTRPQEVVTTTRREIPTTTRRVIVDPTPPPPFITPEPKALEIDGLNFFGEYEAARIPFFGEALRFFQQLNDDIDDYDYEVGYKGRKTPKFCGGRPCPYYKVICKNAFYEVRRYSPLVLVHVIVKGQSYLTNGNKAGFQKLFAYLNGFNKPYVKIPIPTPFVIRTPKLFSAEGQFNDLIEDGEALSYFVPLPAEFLAYPPLPLDPEVKLIYVRDERDVFVSKFAGFATTNIWKTKIKSFRKVLHLKGYNVTKPYAALYNLDAEFANRHNEIIFEVRDSIYNPNPKCRHHDGEKYKRDHDEDDHDEQEYC